MNLRSVGVGLIFFLAANLAQAVYTINIDQVGANVVMTGSGSIDTSSMTALTTIGLCATGNGLVGSTVLCVGTETTADQFDDILIPSLSAFSTTMLDGTSSSGPGVYIFGDDLYLPENYVSAAPISNSSTYAGTTLAALGLAVGTRSLFVPSGDEIVINVGLAPPVAPATPTSIPTLGEYALLGISSLLAMLGIAAVRRKQS
ncbi:MAG: IPTL-CTERM sorting domain-containing protein [Acidovorax sp.]|uniref:IPTL-CTERM sorting domain-containing protein n=1 Tax=Acidovorax sp. TaxID=1872122 RepID=UPI00391DB251